MLDIPENGSAHQMGCHGTPDTWSMIGLRGNVTGRASCNQTKRRARFPSSVRLNALYGRTSLAAGSLTSAVVPARGVLRRVRLPSCPEIIAFAI
jgi:hypothetical protein